MYNSSMRYSYKRKPNEVQKARGRLKNALHDLVGNSDEESFSIDFVQKEKHRGRPKKVETDPDDDNRSQNSERTNQMQYHESFVMKLFDRSLDLSKYDDRTALYPICRAWMKNTPRSHSIRSYRSGRSPSLESREDDGGAVLEKLRNGKIDEIKAMPLPLDSELVRIPSFVDDVNEEGRMKAEMSLKGATKENLLAAHKQRWEKKRRHWQSHTKIYQEQKYELNFQIIDELNKC